MWCLQDGAVPEAMGAGDERGARWERRGAWGGAVPEAMGAGDERGAREERRGAMGVARCQRVAWSRMGAARCRWHGSA